MKKTPVIESKRLLIKQPEDDQCSFFENTLRDPENMKFQGGVMTEEEIKKSRTNMKQHWEKHGFGRFYIFLKDHNKAIGIVGLKFLTEPPKAQTIPDLGYVIAKQYQNQGYATEACEALLTYASSKLGFKTIGARTYPENLAGVSVLKKLGFIKVGSEKLVYNARDYGVADKWELQIVKDLYNE